MEEIVSTYVITRQRLRDSKTWVLNSCGEMNGYDAWGKEAKIERYLTFIGDEDAKPIADRFVREDKNAQFSFRVRTIDDVLLDFETRKKQGPGFFGVL